MSKQGMSPDAKVCNADAKFGILLTSEEAVNSMIEYVQTNGLTGVVTWPFNGREDQPMMSSLDETTLDALMAQAATIGEGAEIIRRLTLEELAEELNDLGVYESTEVVTKVDDKGREFPVLAAKIKGGGVTNRQILDHGIRKQARVLAVSFAEADGKWRLVSYAITQYETGITAIGEKQFLVADYEPFADSDFDAFDLCRDAVIEHRITGGQGQDAWVDSRVQSLVKGRMDQASAESQATDKYNQAYAGFSPVLHAMTRTAVMVADEKFSLEQPKSFGSRVLQPSLADKLKLALAGAGAAE